MDNSEFETQQQAMMRHRRRVAAGRTPEQQSAICEQLQRAAMDAIRSDPAAYQAFLARNHRKRRMDEVQKLEALMRMRCEPDE